jgi:hypothetical protein
VYRVAPRILSYFHNEAAVMRGIALSTVALVALLLPAEGSEKGDGCDKFAWSVARELAWFSARDKVSVTSGETLATRPSAAFVMRLKPAGHASFVLPPERIPRSDGWFGGTVSFPAVEWAGIYQVTLSDEAWVDVIQDGRFVRSVGSSRRRDCPSVQKSVRLELAATSFVLQVSGVASDAIVIAISPSK